MKHIKYLSLIKYGLCVIVIILCTIMCFLKTLEIANNIFKNTQYFTYSYLWLLPQFALIQCPNNLLKISSLILIIFEVVFFDYNRSFLKNIQQLIAISLIYVLLSDITTFLFSTIYFGFKNITISFNVILQSFISTAFFILFALFWSYFAFIILYISKCIFNKKNTVRLVSAALILVESVKFFMHTNISNFLLSPTILSKELVIRQFPYWIKNSWITKEQAFPYASVSKLYPYVNKVPLWFIIIILLIYLILLSIIPIFINKREEIARSYGIIGIPDTTTLEYLQKQIGKPVRKITYKNTTKIIIGKGIFKKKIIIRNDPK